jgi:hypothetical protein
MLCLFGWTIVHFVFIERKKHYPNYCMQWGTQQKIVTNDI